MQHWNHNTHHYPLVVRATPRPCLRALDVGCGEGLLVRALAAQCGRVVGMDRSPEMIEMAQLGAPRNASFVLGDFLTTPVEGGFDLVASVAALHHMDFAAALGRMADLLRPRGVLVAVGLASNATPLDWAFAAAGVPVHHALRLWHGYRPHQAPVIDPTMPWGEVRAAARRVLPGVRWRRHALWRYSLTWTKPG